jgi:hypothetical protein
MNFALRLASNQLPGISVDTQEGVIAGLTGNLSEPTRATIATATSASQRLALALGSPEFQRR